jgi:alkylated DNA repair dioxygenase AlkB
VKDWHDYHPSFLEAGRAKAIFDWLNRQSMKPETGECTKPPTHDTIQWGPRQAYIFCVPSEYRVASSGPIPNQLSKLHSEIEQRYQARFNTIQVNRHWNENSVVHPHSDNMHGDIVMLSLGAPRRFVLRHKHTHKAKNPKWQAGDIFFDEVLPSGSLLTIYKDHQFDLTHEMPKAEQPCDVRISLIWRYLTQSVVKGPLGQQSLIAGQTEYKAAQEAWLKDQGGK